MQNLQITVTEKVEFCYAEFFGARIEAAAAAVAKFHDALLAVVLDKREEGVIPPFLTGLCSRIHAAIFSFCAGVMPPILILGRSLL